MTTAANFLSDGDHDSATARLTIDLGALADNWRTMAARSRPARAGAVLKAEAYGTGGIDAAETLYEAGCRDFFVATPNEGAALRPALPDARLFVFTGAFPGSEPVFIDYDLVPVLCSMEQVAFWSAVTADGEPRPCALQVDTGMNRLGLSVAEALDLASDATRPNGLMPVLVLSHLACADEPDHPLNRKQLESFQRVAAAFEGVESSLANSGGILLGAHYAFDLTRPGIALYGGESAAGSALKPVAHAEARILQIRDVPAGESVSYGAKATASRASRIAVCGIGYADGYPRSSGAGVPLRTSVAEGGYGFLAGHKVPIIGRVTMDLTMFDITDVPSGAVRAGGFIELFGANILLDDAARAAGTIGYELLTSLGPRYARSYI